MSAWNYHGSVTDTDLTQVSLLFFLDKCRSIYLLHVGSSRRLSPGIWMVRSQMLLLTNFEQGFLVSCSWAGYPKCWILRYSQKYGSRKENILLLSDLWVGRQGGCTEGGEWLSSCSEQPFQLFLAGCCDEHSLPSLSVPAGEGSVDGPSGWRSWGAPAHTAQQWLARTIILCRGNEQMGVTLVMGSFWQYIWTGERRVTHSLLKVLTRQNSNRQERDNLIWELC